MSQESSKEEPWEARVDASSGSQYFVNRLTKAVRYSSPANSVPLQKSVSESHHVGMAGSVDVFRKQLVLILSSTLIDEDDKVKQCRYVLADTWDLLCADACGDHAADPIFYVGTLLDVYDSACISASVMLGSDNLLTPCLSFLLKAENGKNKRDNSASFSPFSRSHFYANKSRPFPPRRLLHQVL